MTSGGDASDVDAQASHQEYPMTLFTIKTGSYLLAALVLLWLHVIAALRRGLLLADLQRLDYGLQELQASIEQGRPGYSEGRLRETGFPSGVWAKAVGSLSPALLDQKGDARRTWM